MKGARIMKYVSFPGLGIEPFSMTRGFTVFGHDIAWYGVIICVGIILAVTYSVLRAKFTEKISVDAVTDLAFFLVIFGICGARLYYVIFEFENYVVTGKGVWGNILGTLKNAVAVWNGGLAIYGGIIAGFITVLLFCKIKKINTLKVLDLASPAAMLGQLIGRWGNFVNVEAYGSECTLPWRMGIHIPNAKFENAPQMDMWFDETYVHPTFLYESLWNLLGFAVANIIYRKKRFDGQIFFFYIGWYGFGRMFVEQLRTDSLYIGGTGIRVSQLVAFVTFAFGATMSVYMSLRTRRAAAAAVSTSACADGEAECLEACADCEVKAEDSTAENAENGTDTITTGEENGEAD